MRAISIPAPSVIKPFRTSVRFGSKTRKAIKEIAGARKVSEWISDSLIKLKDDLNQRTVGLGADQLLLEWETVLDKFKPDVSSDDPMVIVINVHGASAYNEINNKLTYPNGALVFPDQKTRILYSACYFRMLMDGHQHLM